MQHNLLFFEKKTQNLLAILTAHLCNTCNFNIILGNGICPGPVNYTSSCTCATEMDKINPAIRSKHSDYARRQPIRIDYYYENENPETYHGLNFDFIKIRSKNGRDMICPSTQDTSTYTSSYPGDDYGLNENLTVFRNGFYCNGPY